MSSQQDGPPATNRNSVILFIVSAYLIGTFLYRLLTPAHEYPMRTEQIMEIGLDVLCLVGLIGLKARFRPGRSFPGSPSRRVSDCLRSV
jgi:hypothetical protein